MRVVAGTAGGRRLRSLHGRGVRPTGERVREAVFASLESMGALDGARVLDLFAGTGALGIEALSRGAVHATFVDDDTRAVATVRTNLEATGFTSRARVVHADVLRFLAVEPLSVEVAFADPPYAFDRWPELLEGLDAELAVLESDREIDVGERWRTTRCRRYGDTVVTVAAAARPSSESS
jgi:16S rRNA (guanine966-N2)-methyltransferase